VLVTGVQTCALPISQNETQAYPVAIENIARALAAAFDMDGAAVRRHISAYAAKPRDKKALRMATDDSNEAHKAYRHISRMYDRIWNKYVSGTLVVDHYDRLREAAADQMDVDMMRTP
jgi:hypothetical protein